MWPLTWTSGSGNYYYFTSLGDNGFILTYPQNSTLANELAAIGEEYKIA